MYLLLNGVLVVVVDDADRRAWPGAVFGERAVLEEARTAYAVP
jgi:CRP-like cAMP-binding protein